MFQGQGRCVPLSCLSCLLFLPPYPQNGRADLQFCEQNSLFISIREVNDLIKLSSPDAMLGG